MALTATQKVTVAEITRETYATIDSLVGSLITEQETSIIADIATWNDNRNDVDFKLTGETNLDAVPLLNAIRERVRKALGLPLYSSEIQQGSVSIPVRGVF